ncbi:MAG: MerR family transcriptional regulator [Acidobacteria bacterium]|nr:MerR family transcriptional regulator [Acidobacteriota bacterium]
MKALGTAEVLQMIDIPRSKLYYLEQKGYISPRKKVIGEKAYRFYSAHDVEKIGLIWTHLRRGLRYRVAYQMATEELRDSVRISVKVGGGKP